VAPASLSTFIAPGMSYRPALSNPLILAINKNLITQQNLQLLVFIKLFPISHFCLLPHKTLIIIPSVSLAWPLLYQETNK